MVGQRHATIDMAAVKAAGCAAIIVRQCYGLRADELALEHNRRADAAGLPRAAYWYPLTRMDPVRQAELAFNLSGGKRLRAFADFEESARNDGADPAWPRYADAYFQHANAGLERADALFGMTTGVYSSKSYLDHWFTAAQQAAWAHRFGWWAHYNLTIAEPWIPAGWKNKPRPWELWQDRVEPFPGVTGKVDQNRVAPGVTLEELLGITATETPAPKAGTPTMPHTKLGPHHMLGGADTRRWVQEARPTVAKFADDFGPAVEALPGTLCLGRVVDDRMPGGVNVDINRLETTHPPMAAAALYVEMLSERIRLNPRIDVWEGPNEPIIRSADVMAWYGAFLHEFARLIALKGKRAGLGGWSVGHPLREDELWPHYVRALQACRDYNAVLTRHEYGPMDGYLSLRYRWDNQQFTALGYPDLPVIISECGADNVPGSGPWKQFYGGDVGRYWNELLLPYTREIERDSFVIGATVFTSGGGGGNGWADFDVTGSGLVARVIEYARTPREKEPMPATISYFKHTGADIDAGLAGKLAEHFDAAFDDAVANGRVYPYGPPAAPPAPLHTLADKTNQQTINLFSTAFGKLPTTAPPYIAAIGRALTTEQERVLFANRTALYLGPAVEVMTLTPDEKSALIAALG